jgi:hypothetical protein
MDSLQLLPWEATTKLRSGFYLGLFLFDVLAKVDSLNDIVLLMLE